METIRKHIEADTYFYGLNCIFLILMHLILLKVGLVSYSTSA